MNNATPREAHREKWEQYTLGLTRLQGNNSLSRTKELAVSLGEVVPGLILNVVVLLLQTEGHSTETGKHMFGIKELKFKQRISDVRSFKLGWSLMVPRRGTPLSHIQ